MGGRGHLCSTGCTDRTGGRAECGHRADGAFSRVRGIVPREAQAAVERQVSNRTCEVRLRVRYAETDQMGVVYHANHFIWFEVGRVELLRQLGFSYREMEAEDNRFIAVAEARCRYKAPAHYDEEVLIRTELLNVRDSVVHFGYELRRAADGAPLAEGETTHIVTDAEMKIAVLPEKYLKAFRAALGKSDGKSS